MATKEKIRIAFSMYDGFDILDVCGPFAFFASQNGLTPVLASETGEPVTALQGFQVIPTKKLKEVSGSEVIWIPGGFGQNYFNQFNEDNYLLEWLNKQDRTAQLICPVCTGAHIAAAADLLNGYTVTTHWMFQQQLLLFPNIRLTSGYPRYWVDRNRVTGGGISSGLDESLAVIAMLLGNEAAMSAQLMNQYAPAPPFNSGSPDIAPPKVLGDFFAANSTDQTQLQTAIEQFLAQ